MSIIIPDKKEMDKAAKKKKKLGKAIKTSKEAEREMLKYTTELWTRVLFPITAKIEQMVKDGASAMDIGYAIEAGLHRAAIEYGNAADNIIDKWRLSVSDDTRRALERGLRQSLGVSTVALLDTPAIREVLEVGGMEAVQLIKTIPQQHLGEVARAVADNFAGRSLPEGRSLLAQIKHVGKVTEKRARVIARDQTSKMTSLLNQTRQQDIGIEEYIWRTVKDERVVGNPSGKYPKGNSKHMDHYHREGKIFRWDSPPPDGHPGQAIQDRCYAEPIIDPQKIVDHARGMYPGLS